MNKKKYFVFAVIFAVLAVLVYLQFRTWRNFDWAKLLHYPLNPWNILGGVLLIYFAYFLRALRWKIFLQPVRKQSSILGLIPPTAIGFAGLALLGRAGEMIRPYLIARREKLPFVSQIAVWLVERIFDFAGVALLLVSAIFLPFSDLNSFTLAAEPKIRHIIQFTGVFLVAFVLGLLFAAFLIAYRGTYIAEWVEKTFSHLSANLGHRIAQKIREFVVGLNTIQGPFEFLQLAVVSVLMWLVIALAYKQVALAYGEPLEVISLAKVPLLMFFSMLGSMVQLPGVGGGSQLATISALSSVFHIRQELAVSCGIMLWLVNFVAIVPVGLFFSRHEHLSLRKLSEETAHAEETEPAPSTP